MYLQKIKLLSYKSHFNAEFAFDLGLNCILGVNGSGKTNLLEAIHFLSNGKGFQLLNDSYLISEGESFFRIDGFFETNLGNSHVACVQKIHEAKILTVNEKKYDKLSEHIGKFPLVAVLPFDTDIIREGSEGRRKFFDQIFSQTDVEYLQHLMVYHHNLKQRNSLLKWFGETKQVQFDLLEPYQVQMALSGQIIFEKRKQFLQDFLPIFKRIYVELSKEKVGEEIDICYKSLLEEMNFEKIFEKYFDSDLKFQRTQKGIHSEDYDFMIFDKLIKKIGSQGQQKTFALALKLAQFELLKLKLNMIPILLLDDIFDKLDEERIDNLLQMIENKRFGQVFITDARAERSHDLLVKKKIQFKKIVF